MEVGEKGEAIQAHDKMPSKPRSSKEMGYPKDGGSQSLKGFRRGT